MNERRSFADVFPLARGAGAPAIPTKGDPQSLAHRAPFRLAAGLVRPSIRTIEGPAGQAKAEPKVMQVLLALVDADGEVLARDDLIDRCWNGLVVGDDAINRAIAEIRRLSRETGAGFTVETIPRTGYRLLEPAQDADGAKTGGPLPPETLVAPDPAPTRRALMAGGLAVAIGGATWWALRPSATDPAAPLIDQSRLAMRASTPRSEARAIALLEQAVARSPGNAEAWGLLALTRARVDEHVIGQPAIPASLVTEAAGRALALNRDNGDARTAIAIATPYYGDWLSAERRFDAVIRDHPEQIHARDSRSFLLGAVGRMRESARDRLAFSPATPIDAGMHFRQVYALWFLDRTAEADRLAWRGLETWPRHSGLWFARLWVLAGTGRFDRAIAHIDDAALRPPLPPPMVATLSTAMRAAQGGQADERRKATAMIMDGVGRNVAGVVNGMMLLNLIGAIDQAFALADAYYLERGPVIAAMGWRPGQPAVPDQRRRKTNMLFTPVATAMRRDPRFMPLVAEMGLADYWARRGVTPDFAARPA